MDNITDVRYIIQSSDGLYRTRGEEVSQDIGAAIRIHNHDDACILANQLNDSTDIKWVAKKVIITYEIK